MGGPKPTPQGVAAISNPLAFCSLFGLSQDLVCASFCPQPSASEHPDCGWIAASGHLSVPASGVRLSLGAAGSQRLPQPRVLRGVDFAAG
jgi:hypothetical protein